MSYIDINQIVLDLQHVNNYFDDEFINFLKNPKVSKANKKEVFEKAFSNIDKNVFATLMILIDNNKIVYLCDVIRELELLIAHEKTINIIETINKELVGGLIIKYDGKIIDGSLFTKQETLKEYLKK